MVILKTLVGLNGDFRKWLTCRNANNFFLTLMINLFNNLKVWALENIL